MKKYNKLSKSEYSNENYKNISCYTFSSIIRSVSSCTACKM